MNKKKLKQPTLQEIVAKYSKKYLSKDQRFIYELGKILDLQELNLLDEHGNFTMEKYEFFHSPLKDTIIMAIVFKYLGKMFEKRALGDEQWSGRLIAAAIEAEDTLLPEDIKKLQEYCKTQQPKICQMQAQFHWSFNKAAKACTWYETEFLKNPPLPDTPPSADCAISEYDKQAILELAKTEQLSVSLISRELKWGFNKAARALDWYQTEVLGLSEETEVDNDNASGLSREDKQKVIELSKTCELSIATIQKKLQWGFNKSGRAYDWFGNSGFNKSDA